MKIVCRKYFLFCFFWIEYSKFLPINAEFDEDSWNSLHDWTRDYLVSDVFQPNGQCCQCQDVEQKNSEQPAREQSQTNAEEVASSVYFKKFVTILFNRNHFEFDLEKQQYKRSVILTINSHQMERLEKLQDPRDIDNIIAEVFNNMRTSSRDCDSPQLVHVRKASTAVTTIVYNILYDILQLLKTSEMQFLLGVAVVILIAWFVNIRFKIGWLLMIVVGVFAFGYFHTYIECNRELEVNKLLEILKSNENEVTGLRFMNFFKSEDAEAQQKQKLKQSAKLSLSFCRPDHVLLMYFNDLFLKYLQALIEQTTVVMSSLSDGFGFPFNFLKPVILVCLIGYVLKLTFKYIFNPSAWTKIYVQNKTYHEEQKAIKRNTNSEEDRISGDNLKLLLKAINVAPLKNSIAKSDQNLANVSGVEDVREAIEEANLDQGVLKLENSRSETSKINNDVCKPADEEKDEKKEDLPQNS